MNKDEFWKRFKKYEEKMSQIEKTVMRTDFIHFVEGNDAFDDASKPEMQFFEFIFESGWIAGRIEGGE